MGTKHRHPFSQQPNPPNAPPHSISVVEYHPASNEEYDERVVKTNKAEGKGRLCATLGVELKEET